MSKRLRHIKYLYITVQMRTTCSPSFEFFEYFVNEYTWWDNLYCVTNIISVCRFLRQINSIFIWTKRRRTKTDVPNLDIQLIDDVCKNNKFAHIPSIYKLMVEC